MAAKTFDDILKTEKISNNDMMVDESINMAKAKDGKWALFIGLRIANAEPLAVEGGENHEDFHVTLAYGYFNGKQHDEGVIDGIVETSLKEIHGLIPKRIHFDAMGRFEASKSSDGKDVIYAQVASGQLEEAHDGLLEALKSHGLKLEPTFHEYKPHMTLAYIEPEQEYELGEIDNFGDVIRFMIGYGAESTSEHNYTLRFVDVAKTFSEVLKANPYHDERGRFASAPGGAAASGVAFSPAKTIEEAREYAKTTLGFSGAVDYSYSYIDQKEVRQVSGTLDIDTVNHINKTITEIQDKYPELKGYAKNLVCTDQNVYAAVVHNGRTAEASLTIGAKAYKDGVESVKKKYAEDVELGYHPKGTDGDAILWHEYGHVYASVQNVASTGKYANPKNKLNAIDLQVSESEWKNKAVQKLMSDPKLKMEYEMLELDYSPASIAKDMGQKISRYATTNNGELFAEAFAAHNTGHGNRWTEALIEAAGA